MSRNLYSSKMFISVILSVAPPEIFNGFKLRGAESKLELRASELAGEIPSEVEGVRWTRGFFVHAYGIREFSRYHVSLLMLEQVF